MLVLTSALLLAAAPVELSSEPLRVALPASTSERLMLPLRSESVPVPLVDQPLGLQMDPAASADGGATQPSVPAVDPTTPPSTVLPGETSPVETPLSQPSPAQTLPSTTAQDEIVITARRATPGDPLQSVNIESFGVTQKVDDAVVGPAAMSYKENVPGPIRKGIRNFLYNLREPIVALNFLLQLKPGKAVETVGRFGINTTIGAIGLVDVAKRKPFRLPRRSNGFANTLGYYGVKNGAFLFLPLIGPTTVRDLVGGAIDRLVLPVGVGSPFTSLAFTVPTGVVGALDHRSRFDRTLKALHDNSPDPYAATRAFYLSRRQAEIDELHGRGSGDPAGMTAAPTSVKPFLPKKLEPQVSPTVTPENITNRAPIDISDPKNDEAKPQP